MQIPLPKHNVTDAFSCREGETNKTVRQIYNVIIFYVIDNFLRYKQEPPPLKQKKFQRRGANGKSKTKKYTNKPPNTLKT